MGVEKLNIPAFNAGSEGGADAQSVRRKMPTIAEQQFDQSTGNGFAAKLAAAGTRSLAKPMKTETNFWTSSFKEHLIHEGLKDVQ
ncbi:hypothetical protein PV05_06651 [Exophiala xenobiotica]|uniref:Uncharacterized protein n=1 Tax=Exophiala xenobiotica TaxID=348802 RepID=A0A0D2F2W4_9EURO|nr:uncharacterized protein PV05_06651 [Exophiala xenobiotica]KIW54284.1 hypothetical protein PV05_06651 [Exophiala xenobiotica]